MNKIKSVIVFLLVFVVPFMFFPFFQNLVQINIVYILAFGALLLVIISFLQLLISKKLIVQTSPLDIPVILFLSAVSLSFFTTATNKMQALLDPSFGLLMMISLAILYYYVSRISSDSIKGRHGDLPLQVLSLSGFVISSLLIVLSLEPTKGIGTIPLDLLIFIGFTFMYSLGSLVRSFSSKEDMPKIVHICTLIIISLALIISLIAFSKQGVLFPSFSLSFKAMLQIFKNPVSALLGLGMDNYSSVFTRVKDIAYNQTSLWQFPAPSLDRSTLFHIISTTGMIGLTSFLYLLFSLTKKIRHHFSLQLDLIYLLCVIIIFPPSLLVFFLLFFLVSQTEKKNKEHVVGLSQSFSLYSYAILIITACVFFGSTIRYLSSLYLADYLYIQSFVGMQENKFNKVYDNQKKALSYNSYAELYHLGFARTHFIFAQNIINKAASGSADVNAQLNSAKSLVFTKESKQMLIEAIQFAITENQIAIHLNPKKAEYWAQLAQTFMLIPKELQAPNETEANSPQTAALTYLKKAMELDPNNPVYYFQIGQILLSQKKTEKGFASIKKATELKPNWADAHYQLGILYANKNDMKNATRELEIALANMDSKTNQKEYDAVKQMLDKIKNPKEP